ncbi:transketolase family protein, partial [Patescibacteria group bacterium]|nr:transketolase family protein [Patescibacteria group bacterium]
VYTLLKAAEELSNIGIEAMVINNSSIKPLDEKTLINSAKICGCAVTLEDHQVAGGMGSAVCELFSEAHPIPIERLGIQNKFGQSGTSEELKKYYKMTKEDIIRATKKVLKQKNK